ncbi:MAG: hypothetical protein AMJ42_01325 [Deltaproteobacteria bacterium DG_8]|nr:MAG: hypothetical protein AMJ42_01325 [Deltaproteobacteria bacterium DG_8]
MGNYFKTTWGFVLKLIGELFWYYLGILPETRQLGQATHFSGGRLLQGWVKFDTCRITRLA